MAEVKKEDRGQMRVDQQECKGCGLCVEACPPKAIALGDRLNHYGYRTASYAGRGCTGCGICFIVCPEPGAITVLKIVHRKTNETGGIATSPERASQCASN